MPVDSYAGNFYANQGTVTGYSEFSINRSGQQRQDWGIYDIYYGGGKLTTGGPVPGVYAIGSDLGVSIQTPGFRLFELVSPHNLVYNNYDLYEEPKQIKYPIDHFGALYNWYIAGQSGFGGNAGFSRRIDRQGNVFEPHVNLRQLLSGDAQNPTVNWKIYITIQKD